MKTAVPVRPRSSIHWRLRDHSTAPFFTRPAQSASTWKKTPSWCMRIASVFTPIFSVRSHSRPLVSSPVRWTSKSPAAKWLTALQPMITISSPAASRIAR